MAKTKTKVNKKQKQSNKSPEELYALSLTALEQSEPDQALTYAQSLLTLVDPNVANAVSSTVPKAIALPALNLLGEISVELGDIEKAIEYFTLAVSADPEGAIPDDQGGGAEKFLWLAQLSEEGGADSVAWFEKGITVLRAQIAALQNASNIQNEEAEVLVEEKRLKIANALCAVTEIYMTDLSWEADAEARCEALVTEAMMFAPESPEVLQTVASVRLSQMKVEDAQSALKRSISLWQDLDPEDEDVPDFATRVSLSRLLMEAELEEEAMEVLQRLKLEDDQSVEACYLGGWCLHLLADKRDKAQSNDTKAESDQERMATLKASRVWLLNTLELCNMLNYEDDRLKEHTEELIADLNESLGPPPKDGAVEEEEEEDWEDDESADEEMADS